MNQSRKGIRSTKIKIEKFTQNHTNDTNEIPKKDNNIYVKIYNSRDTIFTDRNSKFLSLSCGGHKYIMVLSATNENAIMFDPMKNITKG